MSQSAWFAHGVLLKRGNGASPEVFTSVAEVGDVDGPGLDSDELDVTDHASGGWEETKQGLKKGGEVSFPIFYLPAATTHKNSSGGLIYDFVNNGQSPGNWQVVWPSSPTETWQFAGWVKTFSPKGEVKGVLTADITLKVTGAVSFAVT